ncbi:hypothetical protein PA7559_12150 [Pseudoalteromonas distincta]
MRRLLYKYQDIHSTDAKGFVKTMIVTNRYKALPVTIYARALKITHAINSHL